MRAAKTFAEKNGAPISEPRMKAEREFAHTSATGAFFPSLRTPPAFFFGGGGESIKGTQGKVFNYTRLLPRFFRYLKGFIFYRQAPRIPHLELL